MIRRLLPGGLRAQLALAIGLVTVIALSASFLALYSETSSRLQAQIDARLRTQAAESPATGYSARTQSTLLCSFPNDGPGSASLGPSLAWSRSETRLELCAAPRLGSVTYWSAAGPLRVMMFCAATVVGISHFPWTIGPTARKRRLSLPDPVMPL